MSPSVTPATQSEGRCHQVPRLHTARANQARHESQPSAISARPATQSGGRCRQAPRLPDKVKVDVTKCHAFQRGDKSQPRATSARLATQSGGRCCQVLRLPHKVKVDVTNCHTCRAEKRWLSPSVKPTAARRNEARHKSQPTAVIVAPATQSEDHVADDGCYLAPSVSSNAGMTARARRAPWFNQAAQYLLLVGKCGGGPAATVGRSGSTVAQAVGKPRFASSLTHIVAFLSSSYWRRQQKQFLRDQWPLDLHPVFFAVADLRRKCGLGRLKGSKGHLAHLQSAPP
eukprot:s2238_g8.t1